MIGTQQMEDCSLDHPAAGQAAPRPAWRKPRPPQRGPPANAIPAPGSEGPQMPFNPAQLGNS